MATTPSTFPTHIRDLTFDPRNPRQHTPRNIGMIADVLQTIGPARSIVIDEKNEIIAGNGVIEAAAQAGITHVRVYDRDTGELGPAAPEGEPSILAVRVTGLTDAQKREYAVADNRTGDLSSWDTEVLAELMDEGVDLGAYWFEEELGRMLGQEPEPDDPYAEWEGMPEYSHQDKTAFRSLTVHFKDQEAVDQFATLVDQAITPKTRFLWFPEIEIERYADKRYASQS